ncbi:MAG TPA: ABC transporter permease, partial [bacterium]|nr:ABC transporter permease [bacterium]
MLSSTPGSATRSVAVPAAERGAGRSAWRLAARRFWRNANARAGLFLIVLFGIIAVFAPKIAPYGLDDENLV